MKKARKPQKITTRPDRKAPRRGRTKSDASGVIWEQLEFEFEQEEKKRGT